MTRDEHLAWCKQRANEYADAGDISQAYASMMSDMRKHPELADHSGLMLGMMLMVNGHLNSPREMRKFIDGFN